MDISVQEEISQVRVVEAERSYWFIRTYSGELYNYFYENSFVGLGLNHIPYKYIEEANADDTATFSRLQTYIANSTEYKKGEATKWAKQLISFDHEIKVDDIVIIPSKSSEYLAFGLVESETYVTKDLGTFKFGDKIEQYPEKRKRIKWLKEIPKYGFRGELKAMFSTHNAVTDVNRFSEIIEGNLSTLYIKDKQIYLSIKIDQDEEINAFELQRFLEGLTYLYKEYCRDYGIQDNEDLFIKIKVQSKGGVFLKGIGIAALVSIAGIIHLASDPEVIKALAEIEGTTGLLTIAAVLALSDSTKVKIELGKLGKVEGQSAGLLKSLSNFLDSSQKRKIELMKFTQSIEKLKAKPIDNSVTKEQDQIDSPEK